MFVFTRIVPQPRPIRRIHHRLQEMAVDTDFEEVTENFTKISNEETERANREAQAKDASATTNGTTQRVPR